MAKTYRLYLPDQDFLLPPSLRDWLPEGHLAYFVGDLVDALDLSAIMAVYDPILLAFDILLFGAILIILFPLGSNAVRTAVLESKAKYGLVAWLEELARHPITFKSAAAGQLAVARADVLTGDYLKSRSRHFRILFRQAIGAALLQAIGTAALLGVGGFLVINNRLTIGQLIASELIVSAVLAGMLKFSKQLESVHDLLAAVDKLGYFVELPLEPDGSDSLPRTGATSIRMAGITYAYGDPRMGQQLKGIDWEIPAGARIALSGRSGAGKSTLIDLLYGLRLPLSGVLEINGADSRNVLRPEWRASAALVRDAEVFEGTIDENLRLACADIGNAQLRDALALTGLLDAVQALPEALDTKLTTGGRPLSQSQVLRLMLARAVVHRPQLLLIDEVLDQIEDAAECAALASRLLDRRNPWTVVVSSRRGDVHQFCDAVYTLEEGKLLCLSSKPSV